MSYTKKHCCRYLRTCLKIFYLSHLVLMKRIFCKESALSEGTTFQTFPELNSHFNTDSGLKFDPQSRCPLKVVVVLSPFIFVALEEFRIGTYRKSRVRISHRTKVQTLNHLSALGDVFLYRGKFHENNTLYVMMLHDPFFNKRKFISRAKLLTWCFF